MAKKTKSIPHEKGFPTEMFEQSLLPHLKEVARTQGRDQIVPVEGFYATIHQDGTYDFKDSADKGE